MAIVRTTDPAEAEALEASGARLLRHADDMARPLDADRTGGHGQALELPAGLELAEVDEGWVDRIALASLDAFPPDHPDHAPGETVTLVDAVDRYSRLIRGERAGGVISRASGLLVDEAGNRVVGAALITELAASPVWPGGPWVADAFVVPQWHGHGLGQALLKRAIVACSALGHARIGLSVTVGNPAARLYERLGFSVFRSVYVFDLEEPGA